MEAIRDHRPDLVFLDVQMPDLDGFQVIEALPSPPPSIVFVTAYDEHALRAFEVAAVDYLLKPLQEERFRACLERVVDRLRTESPAPPFDVTALVEAHRRALVERDGRFWSRLTVPTRSGHRVLEVGQIAWIEAHDYYSALHVGAKSYLVKVSLSRLAAQLDPRQFVRVHRSTIVNLDAVDSVETPSATEQTVVLADGTRRRVSRSGLRNLQQALEMLR